jgi:hypothetical protein
MSSSPQRQREHGSPARQGGGGYPPAMYGGMPGGMPNHPYNGGHPMPMKQEFESSPQRYGPPPQGPHSFGGPQAGGYHHPLGQPGVGQFGQYPYYGGYGGPPGNGYFPAQPTEFGARGGPGGPFGGPGSFPSSSPNRKQGQGYIQGQGHPSNHSHPSENKSSSSPQNKVSTPGSETKEENKMKESSSSLSPPQEAKSAEKSVASQDKSSPSSTRGEEKSQGDVNHEHDGELSSDVNPMRSDFHFFALDHKDETLEKIKKDSSKEKKENDNKAETPFILMTDLNERLMALWEGASNRVRTVYMQKEESDRYRFMSEDEIASRHCATLTSRTSTRKVTATPSSAVANVVTKDEEDDSSSLNKSGTKRQSSETVIDEATEVSAYESPTKKTKDSSTGNSPNASINSQEKVEKEQNVDKKEDTPIKEDKTSSKDEIKDDTQNEVKEKPKSEETEKDKQKETTTL